MAARDTGDMTCVNGCVRGGGGGGESVWLRVGTS